MPQFADKARGDAEHTGRLAARMPPFDERDDLLTQIQE